MSALNYIPTECRDGYHRHAQSVLVDVFQQHGVRALESTRKCAALHEAGHCIVNTITADADQGGQFGSPDSTRIWRAPVKGATVWLGETLPHRKAPPLHINAKVDPMSYLAFMVRTMGGIAAELAFDGADYRAGSSIDEWIVAGGCARTLAELGAYPSAEAALMNVLRATTFMLTANETVVRAIATQLEEKRHVHGAELAGLLRPVQKNPPLGFAT